MRKTLITTAKIVLLSATAVFVGKVFWDNWGEFLAGWRAPNAALAAAAALLIASYLYLLYVSLRVLRRVGWNLKPRSALRPFFYTLLGRYVPGRFAVIVGKVYLYEKRGIPKLESVVAPAYENVFAAIGGITAALAAAVALLGTHFTHWQLAPGVAALAFLIVVIQPGVQKRLLRFFLRKFDGGGATPRVIVGFRSALGFAGAYVGYCVLLGAFFALFASAFLRLDWTAGLRVGAAYAAASVLGYVVVISPSGLGVRESLLILLLKPYMGAGDAAFLAVASRVVSVIAELALAALAAAIGDNNPARPTRENE